MSESSDKDLLGLIGQLSAATKKDEEGSSDGKSDQSSQMANALMQLLGGQGQQGQGQPQDAEAPPEQDSALLCLMTILAFHQMAADFYQLQREYKPDEKAVDFITLLLAARENNLKAAFKKNLKVRRLPKTPLPIIARNHDGLFFLVIKASKTQVVAHFPTEKDPNKQQRVFEVHEFEAYWTGEALLTATRSFLTAASLRFGVGWFIPVFFKYKWILGEVLFASFMLQLFGLLTPLFFQTVVDKVIVHQSVSTLDVLFFGYVSLIVFQTILEALRSYTMAHTTNRIDVELGAKLFKHMMKLPLSYFETRQTGQTVARIHELDSVREFITGNGLTVLLDAVFVVVYFFFMWGYSHELTWIVLASVPIYVTISIFITAPLRRKLEMQFQCGARNQSFLVESVNCVGMLKASAIEPQMRKSWEEKLSEYVRNAFEVNKMGIVGSQLVKVVSMLTSAFIIWVGARLVMEEQMTIGQLIAFNMLSGQISAPILRLGQLWQDLQQFFISIERLGDILNAPTESTRANGASEMPPIEGAVRFEKVRFSYTPDGDEVLKGVSFEIKAGEVIGFVGRSGSGKSTISKLVQDLYVPNSGKVTVDDQDLSLLDPSWLRRQMGVVLQENVLLNRTIRENISITDPSVPMEKVIKAAELSGAHGFIVDLKAGYDTMIEEGGTNLSGGQRQRIALARALIGNPKILILDEATSALDYESEQIIQTNMKDIVKNKTVIIIAHRLSTLRDADRIFVMDKGEIAESGSQEELLEKDGLYAYLHKQQF